LDDRLLGDSKAHDKDGRVYVNHINLAVHYPDLTPAEPIYSASNRFIALSIVNSPPGEVRRSLDGSWLNYYSRYKKPAQEAFGLAKRMSGDFPFDSDYVLYRFGADYDVRIECRSNPNRPIGSCTMLGQWSGEPGIETSFEQADLPSWFERLRRLKTLFRVDGRGLCGTPCKAP